MLLNEKQEKRKRTSVKFLALLVVLEASRKVLVHSEAISSNILFVLVDQDSSR